MLPALSCFVTMTRYDDSFDLPAAFGPQRLTNIFGQVLSDHGIAQLRVAETENTPMSPIFQRRGGTEFDGESGF